MLRLLAVSIALLLLGVACSGPDRPPPPPSADDLAAARSLLTEARDRIRDPEWQPAHVRAILMVEVGLWDEAAEIEGRIETPIERDLARAVRMLRSHRYLEAADAVDRILLADSDHEPALFVRAELELVADLTDRARATGERLLELDRNSADAAVLLGRLRLGEGDAASARDWARQARRWDPRHAEAHLLDTEALLATGDDDGARRILLRALELDPLHPDGRFLYGALLEADSGTRTAAAAHWDLALEVNPLHLATHLYLAGAPVTGTGELAPGVDAGDGLPHGDVVALIAARRDAFQEAVSRNEALPSRP
jgi:tetratricopeptide (TPR) repeat protein